VKLEAVKVNGYNYPMWTGVDYVDEDNVYFAYCKMNGDKDVYVQDWGNW